MARPWGSRSNSTLMPMPSSPGMDKGKRLAETGKATSDGETAWAASADSRPESGEGVGEADPDEEAVVDVSRVEAREALLELNSGGPAVAEDPEVDPGSDELELENE